MINSVDDLMDWRGACELNFETFGTGENRASSGAVQSKSLGAVCFRSKGGRLVKSEESEIGLIQTGIEVNSILIYQEGSSHASSRNLVL